MQIIVWQGRHLLANESFFVSIQEGKKSWYIIKYCYSHKKSRNKSSICLRQNWGHFSRLGLRRIINWIEQDNCFIIQQIDNKTYNFIRPGKKLFYLQFSLLRRTKLSIYQRISVTYGWQILRESWPYLDSVTICWIINNYSLKSRWIVAEYLPSRVAAR